MRNYVLGIIVGASMVGATWWGTVEGSLIPLGLEWSSFAAFLLWGTFQLSSCRGHLRHWLLSGALVAAFVIGAIVSGRAGVYYARRELVRRASTFTSVAETAAREVNARGGEIEVAPPFPEVTRVVARPDDETGGVAVRFVYGGTRRGVVVYVAAVRAPQLRGVGRCLHPLVKDVYQYYPCK